MVDPTAARIGLNEMLAAHGEPAVPVDLADSRYSGVLGEIKDSIIRDFASTRRHEPIEWWLDLLESVDFAAAGVSGFFGGQRVYIRKGRTPEQKAEAIGAYLRAGLAAEDAFKAAGVSRATGYRLIGRPQRRGGAG